MLEINSDPPKHTVLALSKDDIFCSLMDFYHKDASIREDDIIEIVSPEYNCLSEDDVAEIAKELGRKLLKNQFLGELFWDEIGIIARRLIQQKKETREAA